MLSSFYTEVSYAWLVGTQAVQLTALELTGRLAASRQRRANQHFAAARQAHNSLPGSICAEPRVTKVGGQGRRSGAETAQRNGQWGRHRSHTAGRSASPPTQPAAGQQGHQRAVVLGSGDESVLESGHAGLRVRRQAEFGLTDPATCRDQRRSHQRCANQHCCAPEVADRAAHPG